MEYGLIPRINQYVDNNQVQIQQVQATSEVALLKNDNETEQLSKDNFLKGVDSTSSEKTSESSKSKEVSAQDVAQYQEVALTNLNFGYNSSSKDFYVKAVRGESESQFPTDEMMKLKAYFIAQAKAESMAELS